MMVGVWLTMSMPGCGGSEEKGTVEQVEAEDTMADWMVLDSNRFLRNDTLFKEARMMGAMGEANQYSFVPHVFDPFDDITYTVKDGELLHVRMMYSREQQTMHQEYSLDSGELGWARFRIWDKVPGMEQGREVYFFVDSDTLYYVSERTIDLVGGEPPAEISQLPLDPSQRSREELDKELRKYWDKIYDLVKEDMDLQSTPK
jgi:hypothetical protein